MSALRLTRKNPGVNVVFSDGSRVTLAYDPGKMTKKDDAVLNAALKKLMQQFSARTQPNKKVGRHG